MSKEIMVDLCLTLVKHGFKFVKTNDLGDLDGICGECGHAIRYEQIYLDLKTEQEHTIGSECQYKIFVLHHWKDQFPEEDLENSHLQRAGKWLWVLHRDHLLEKLNEKEVIPQPRDYRIYELDNPILDEIPENEMDEFVNENIDNLEYEVDYKKLADDMKNLVMRVRRRIKKEAEEKSKKEERKTNMELFLERHGINKGFVLESEHEFLKTMYRADHYGWKLTAKQEKWFNDIKRRKEPKKSNNNNNNNTTNNKKDDLKSLIVKMMDVVASRETDVNDWEINFIYSIKRQLNEGRNLTAKQMNIVERIKGKCNPYLSQSTSVKEPKPYKQTYPSGYQRPVQEEPKRNLKQQPNQTNIGKFINEAPELEVKPVSIVLKIDEINSDYVGQETKTWIINEKFDVYTCATVSAVYKESDDAILCDLMLQGVEDKLRKEVWIPKKAMKEYITL